MTRPHSQREVNLAPSGTNMIPGIRCPCCDSENMITSQTEYNVDHFGSVLFNITKCPKCGFRQSDVISLETREPTLVQAKINSLADLDTKVIKSGTATIRIPEFGAYITPGPHSEGFITNVEGVLAKVEDALTFMLGSAEPERVRIGEKILKQIRTARASNPCFTIIIEDPLGNSGLVASDPSKIEKRKLTKDELKEIRFGQYASDSSGIVSH
jgi:zinc finger protein